MNDNGVVWNKGGWNQINPRNSTFNLCQLADGRFEILRKTESGWETQNGIAWPTSAYEVTHWCPIAPAWL